MVSAYAQGRPWEAPDWDRQIDWLSYRWLASGSFLEIDRFGQYTRVYGDLIHRRQIAHIKWWSDKFDDGTTRFVYFDITFDNGVVQHWRFLFTHRTVAMVTCSECKRFGDDVFEAVRQGRVYSAP